MLLMLEVSVMVGKRAGQRYPRFPVVIVYIIAEDDHICYFDWGKSHINI